VDFPVPSSHWSPRVATKHYLFKNIRDINLCTDFEKLKVKVAIICFGTQGWTLVICLELSIILGLFWYLSVSVQGVFSHSLKYT
jgi:hypothetical protein